MKTDLFTAIVTSHDNERGLRAMLGNLRYQTRPPDQTLVFASETPDFPRLREDFPDVTFIARPDRDDWGHEKRAEGVARAAGDWLGFFNDDDSYSLAYIEEMMKRAGPGIDAVYCWWSRFPEGCCFQSGSSTSGNFIVRTSLARQVGYEARDYEADGHFIGAISAQAREIMLVPKSLYHWNDPSKQRGE